MPGTQASRLVLRSDLAELDRLTAWLQSLSRRSDLPPDLSFAVAHCLEEAVANIIMYGGDDERAVEISIEVERDGAVLIARVEDNGRQFDPTRAPAPPVRNSLERARIGELGIHLMRSFADEMRYERRDDRNCLTLRFAQGRNAHQRPE
jgi:serine/threonine-protein kinase RsbW